jgi:hypothetical protein
MVQHSGPVTSVNFQQHFNEKEYVSKTLLPTSQLWQTDLGHGNGLRVKPATAPHFSNFAG